MSNLTPNGSDSPAPSPSLDAIAGLYPEEIAEALGEKAFRGNQLFGWVHGRRVFDFDAMTDQSKATREKLPTLFRAQSLTPADHNDSSKAEGTYKTLFTLADGDTIESVHIQQPKHSTLCLSTQVGCAVKCSFCATGLSGYARNLSAAEIVEQALHLVGQSDLGERTPNIVMMGMGEPFRNYEATMKAVRLLMHPKGLNIGARKITISTVGEVDGIRRFAEEGLQVRLSVSLHAANDELRSELVPLNKKYPLSALTDAIEYYVRETGRRITFEWTLLDGVNDRMSDAEELAQLARQFDAKVNLIPYNPVEELGYKAPTGGRAKRFADAVASQGVNVTLRAERGQDINAACGQLRRRAS